MHSDRLNSRRRRPAFDSMEERQLLTGLLMVDSPRMVEGTGGSTAMTFTVKLVAPDASTVKVDYATANGSAAASDYTPTAGTLSFAPGETIKTVSVPINPDAVAEANETFCLKLSRPINGIILAATGTATILDDDTVVAPALSISDVQMRRGLSGMRSMAFTVSLSGPQKESISVVASTANITAIVGKDYQAKSELLTFAPGETKKTFVVEILGTPTSTPDVVFMVNLSSVTKLTRATGYGILKYGA